MPEITEDAAYAVVRRAVELQESATAARRTLAELAGFDLKRAPDLAQGDRISHGDLHWAEVASVEAGPGGVRIECVAIDRPTYIDDDALVAVQFIPEPF
jgi:hypothetical protein